MESGQGEGVSGRKVSAAWSRAPDIERRERRDHDKGCAKCRGGFRVKSVVAAGQKKHARDAKISVSPFPKGVVSISTIIKLK